MLLTDNRFWEIRLVLDYRQHCKYNSEIVFQFCPHKMLFRTVVRFHIGPHCIESLASS